MKRLLVSTIFFATACFQSAPPAAASDWESGYASLLKKYVSPSGVAYKKWKADDADLARLRLVVDSVAVENLSGKSRDEKLAFYLNAYNAWILNNILADYPTKGPGNGSALKRAYFFKSKSINIAGKKMSFSSLENDIIRPQFDEPRIHFALNCASASCPPLLDKPFSAATLDTDLTALARAYLNTNSLGLELSSGGETVRLSEIFDWYADDFAPDALMFVNRYRDRKIPAGTKIQFMDYDWSLNEVR